jgi:hypothetical protein
VHLLHSQRTDGGDKAGLVGLSLTERKAPTKTAREISADMDGLRFMQFDRECRAEQSFWCLRAWLFGQGYCPPRSID